MRDESRSNEPLTKGDLQTILDHITNERRNAENYIDEKLEGIEGRLDNLENDVREIKSVYNLPNTPSSQRKRGS